MSCIVGVHVPVFSNAAFMCDGLFAISSQGAEADAKQLMISKGRETRIEDPEDEVWPLHVYEAKYGDYRTNGLGHKWTDLGGNIQGVLVPGRQVFKVKRARAMSAVVQEVTASCLL